jgi:hypothetical protein
MAAYFLPVNVLEAVTVAPGSGVLPLRAEPLISNEEAVAVGAVGDLALGVDVGAGGTGSCAHKDNTSSNATEVHVAVPRRIDFNLRSLGKAIVVADC